MRSIRTLLCLSISMVIVFAGVATSSVYYHQALAREKADIDQLIQAESAILSSEIALALWEYDLKGIRVLCNERLKRHRIQSIRITDDDQHVLFDHPAGNPGESVSIAKPIRYDGERIGTMRIAFDDSPRVEFGQEIFQVTGYVLFFVAATAIAAVFLLTQRLVAGPFDHVARILGELKDERYTWRYPESDLKEIQPIIHGLKLLSRELVERDEKIRKHTRQLETHNQNLLDEISRRQAAEKKLARSEERYKLAMEFANDGLWDWNLETHEIYFSPVWKNLLGYADSELPNDFSVWEQLTDPEDVERAWKIQKEVIARKRDRFEIEFKMKHKNGHWVEILSRAKAVFNEKGEAARMIGTHVDITERKKAMKEREKLEQELRQSQKIESVGNLAGGIAHDFNNILASIIGFTELALDEVDTHTAVADSLQEVYSAGKRARELVKQILTFARQSDEKKCPLQLSAVVQEALQFIRSTLPTSIEIRQKIDSEAMFLGNATQIHQVLMNLCSNAAHAMSESGGVLTVSVKDVAVGTQPACIGPGTGAYIEMKVSDTGTGIAPEMIESIFDPYFTTRGPGEGTGMGLAVVHGIIESCGGKIAVDSQLGKGTTFTITLPVSEKRAAVRDYTPKPLPCGAERILFVDDEASLAKMGGRMLSRLGYAVTTCTSSREALERFRSAPDEFDLVITDMTMPGMTGDRLAVALMKARPDIPVILCTGYSNRISEEAAAEIGIRAFSYKPIVKADLAKTVRNVLDAAATTCRSRRKPDAAGDTNTER